MLLHGTGHYTHAWLMFLLLLLLCWDWLKTNIITQSLHLKNTNTKSSVTWLICSSCTIKRKERFVTARSTSVFSSPVRMDYNWTLLNKPLSIAIPPPLINCFTAPKSILLWCGQCDRSENVVLWEAAAVSSTHESQACTITHVIIGKYNKCRDNG